MCVRIQHSDVCAALWKSERAWFERLPKFLCKHDARLSRVSHDGRPIIWAVSHLASPAYPHLPPYLSSSSPPTVSRSSDGSNRPTKFQVGTSYSSPAPHRHAMLRFFKTFHTKIIVIAPHPRRIRIPAHLVPWPIHRARQSPRNVQRSLHGVSASARCNFLVLSGLYLNDWVPVLYPSLFLFDLSSLEVMDKKPGCESSHSPAPLSLCCFVHARCRSSSQTACVGFVGMYIRMQPRKYECFFGLLLACHAQARNPRFSSCVWYSRTLSWRLGTPRSQSPSWIRPLQLRPLQLVDMLHSALSPCGIAEKTLLRGFKERERARGEEVNGVWSDAI